ncbi:MAG: RagB/SusD family nutrient uptake outer membrane protein [Bacteroidales bacterium]|nr:RagB/SusD family nutrient uptake outer membrane protein [Bacteroidales bacterium]
MKKYITLLLCAVGLLLVSCNQDRLEIPQKGVVPVESFYITDEDAESAMTALYERFLQQIGTCRVVGTMIYTPWRFAFNLPGDDMYAACKSYGDNDFQGSVDEFRFDASADIITCLYQHCYKISYGCNLVTDHFEYGQSAVKDRCISEARVIRAWCHMILAIGFNDPPLVDHVLEGDAKPANYEGGHKGLLEWCAKECEEAAPKLRKRNGTGDKDGTIVITQGFAYAVQGKSLMFAEEYDKAMVPLKKVIDSGDYALVPGPEYIYNFHVEGDGNAEKIFELNVNTNPNLSDRNQLFRSVWQEANMWCWRTDQFAAVPKEVGLGANGWGGLGVRTDFAEEFIANDGDSYRRKATMLSYEEVLTDLTYANDGDMTKEEKLRDPKRGINSITGLYANGEYLQWKLIISDSDVKGHSRWGENNFRIMRYAEVLLMYAECCAQTGKDLAGGLECILQIQKRAGIPVENYATACTLDVVKKEKKFELWGEGCRFPDCVRWGDIAGMQKSGGPTPTLTDSFFSPDPAVKTDYHKAVVTYREYNKERGIDYGFKKGKHEFFPFPDSETSVNPNIRQNPGW